MFKRFTQYASKAALVLAVSAMGATTAFAASNTQGTANNANTAYKGTVLVVASSEDKLTMADGSAMNVGFYLNEFAQPTEYLAANGYKIVLATPNGTEPVMDKGSDDPKFFGNDANAMHQAEQFVQGLKPISLAEAKAHEKDYDAIFVPGGHSPMTDLMQNSDLGTLLRDFHKEGKTTAFICHGSVAALAALPDAAAYRADLVAGNYRQAQALAKDWIYKGYQLTGFSNGEEVPGEIRNGHMLPFHVMDALQNAGATISNGAPGASYVVVDREVITAQNPSSAVDLGKAILKRLQSTDRAI